MYLPDFAEQAYHCAVQRGQAENTEQSIKHLAGEITEVAEAYGIYHAQEKSDRENGTNCADITPLLFELSDVIINALSIARQEGCFNMESFLLSKLEANKARAIQSV